MSVRPDHICTDETATAVNGRWICQCPKGPTKTSLKVVTGTRLPNGAVVLLETRGVVLAVSDGPEPFITWRWDGKDPASTWSGHYYPSISAAALDFEARIDGLPFPKEGRQR